MKLFLYGVLLSLAFIGIRAEARNGGFVTLVHPHMSGRDQYELRHIDNAAEHATHLLRTVTLPNQYDTAVDPQAYLMSLADGTYATVSRSRVKGNDRIHFKRFNEDRGTLSQATLFSDSPKEHRYSISWPRGIQLSRQAHSSRLRNGDLIVAASRVDTWGDKGGPSYGECKFQPGCLFRVEVLLFRSSDLGRNWKLWTTVKQDPLDYFSVDEGVTDLAMRGGLWQPTPVELEDGTLGLLVTDQWIGIHADDIETCESYRNRTYRPFGVLRDDTLSFYRSDNHGLDWPEHQRFNVYTGPCGSNNNEGHIVALWDGRLAVVFKGGDRDRETRQRVHSVLITYSYDDGETWTDPSSVASQAVFDREKRVPIIRSDNPLTVEYQDIQSDTADAEIRRLLVNYPSQ